MYLKNKTSCFGLTSSNIFLTLTFLALTGNAICVRCSHKSPKRLLYFRTEWRVQSPFSLTVFLRVLQTKKTIKNSQALDKSSIPTWWSARQGRQIPDLYDLYDLYDLAHVAGWKPYNLHDLAQVSWVWSVQYTDPTQHLITAGYIGSRWARSWSICPRYDITPLWTEM